MHQSSIPWMMDYFVERYKDSLEGEKPTMEGLVEFLRTYLDDVGFGALFYEGRSPAYYLTNGDTVRLMPKEAEHEGDMQPCPSVQI